MTETNQSTVPCFDNDLTLPSDYTLEEMHVWRSMMVGRASVHVPQKVWDRLRAECSQDIQERRARGVR